MCPQVLQVLFRRIIQYFDSFFALIKVFRLIIAVFAYVDLAFMTSQHLDFINIYSDSNGGNALYTKNIPKYS